MIIDYPWYYVLFCLLAGAAYAAGLYYVGRRRFGKGVNALLAALRFVAVSAIALLLLAPVAKRTVNEQQTPIVVVAQDVSESIDSTQLTVDGFLKGEPYEMVYETFGGTTTDIASELSDIASRYQGRNLGAVVLATDGIYNRGGNPATTAERLSFPVYTVALGDTTPQRDAAAIVEPCSAPRPRRLEARGGKQPQLRSFRDAGCRRHRRKTQRAGRVQHGDTSQPALRQTACARGAEGGAADVRYRHADRPGPLQPQ